MRAQQDYEYRQAEEADRQDRLRREQEAAAAEKREEERRQAAELEVCIGKKTMKF